MCIAELLADSFDRIENLSSNQWIAIVGFLQLIVFGFQAIRLRQTVEEMKTARTITRDSADAAIRAAIATEKTVELMDNTAKAQLRAYVFIEKSQVEFKVLSGSHNVTTQTSDFDRQVETTLEIKNTGQTPAHDLQIFGQIDFCEWQLPFDETKLKSIDYSGREISKESIGPASFRHKKDVIGINETQWQQLNAGTHAIFVYGEIKYKDVFGNPQSTYYRYFTGGAVKLSRGNSLVAHDTGNYPSCDT